MTLLRVIFIALLVCVAVCAEYPLAANADTDEKSSTVPPLDTTEPITEEVTTPCPIPDGNRCINGINADECTDECDCLLNGDNGFYDGDKCEKVELSELKWVNSARTVTFMWPSDAHFNDDKYLFVYAPTGEKHDDDDTDTTRITKRATETVNDGEVVLERIRKVNSSMIRLINLDSGGYKYKVCIVLKSNASKDWETITDGHDCLEVFTGPPSQLRGTSELALILVTTAMFVILIALVVTRIGVDWYYGKKDPNYQKFMAIEKERKKQKKEEKAKRKALLEDEKRTAMGGGEDSSAENSNGDTDMGIDDTDKPVPEIVIDQYEDDVSADYSDMESQYRSQKGDTVALHDTDRSKDGYGDTFESEENGRTYYGGMTVSANRNDLGYDRRDSRGYNSRNNYDDKYTNDKYDHNNYGEDSIPDYSDYSNRNHDNHEQYDHSRRDETSRDTHNVDQNYDSEYLSRDPRGDFRNDDYIDRGHQAGYNNDGYRSERQPDDNSYEYDRYDDKYDRSNRDDDRDHRDRDHRDHERDHRDRYNDAHETQYNRHNGTDDYDRFNDGKYNRDQPSDRYGYSDQDDRPKYDTRNGDQDRYDSDRYTRNEFF